MSVSRDVDWKEWYAMRRDLPPLWAMYHTSIGVRYVYRDEVRRVAVTFREDGSGPIVTEDAVADLSEE
jgi:hypothetical protein